MVQGCWQQSRSSGLWVSSTPGRKLYSNPQRCVKGLNSGNTRCRAGEQRRRLPEQDSSTCKGCMHPIRGARCVQSCAGRLLPPCTSSISSSPRRAEFRNGAEAIPSKHTTFVRGWVRSSQSSKALRFEAPPRRKHSSVQAEACE